MVKRLTDPTEAPRILIAASGTGGHLFPAIYIALAFKRADPRCEISFIGSGRPLEAKLIDPRGYHRYVIRTVGVMNRGLRGILEYGCTFPAAILQTRSILKSFDPHIVIGVGGYVSVLPVVLARLKGAFTWIHEGELKPGLANWLLSLLSHRTSIAFEQARMPSWARVVYTGHPVRPELTDMSCDWQRGDTPKKVLVMGGSQGAQAIDDACEALCKDFVSWGMELLHQTRPENVERLKASYQQAGLTAEVVPFIDDLAHAFRWCDLVLSRAGAGAVMEIGVVNKPAILVPYPHAQGNHQLANARTLCDAGKALIVEQGPQFEQRLKGALEQLREPSEYANFLARPGVTRSTTAADEIVHSCLELRGLQTPHK